MTISETQAAFIWIAIGALSIAWGVVFFPPIAGVAARVWDDWFPTPEHPLPHVTLHHDPEFGTVALTAELSRRAESLLRNEFGEHRLNTYIDTVLLPRWDHSGQRGGFKKCRVIHFDPGIDEAHLVDIFRACEFPVIVKQCER